MVTEWYAMRYSLLVGSHVITQVEGYLSGLVGSVVWCVAVAGVASNRTFTRVI